MDETDQTPTARDRLAEPCAVDDCDKPRESGRRLCSMHRSRMKRHGQLELPLPAPRTDADRFAQLAARFWDNVGDRWAELGICWEWTGRRHAHRSGELDYGVMSVYDPARGMTVTRMAHVVAWRVQMGRWPGDGEQVHHECRNPLCVRWEHLTLLRDWEHDREHARRWDEWGGDW